MAPDMHCPACGSDMRSRSLHSHYSLKPYRVCPDCGAKYRSDPDTRRRLWPILLLGTFTFCLTATAGLRGSYWWIPTLLSHAVLWSYLGYVLNNISFVEYEK